MSQFRYLGSSLLVGSNIHKLKLTVSLCVLASTLMLTSSYAQTVTISEDRETSITTSTVDNNNPADVVINEDVEVSVTGGTVVTVDSDNNITNNGEIRITENDDNLVGLHITTENGMTRTSDYTASGIIRIGNTSQDSDYGSNNFDILIDGAGTYQGDITGDATAGLVVYGNNSAALSLQTEMVGNIVVDTVNVTGDNSNGIEILGNLTGNIEVNDAIIAGGLGNHGIYLGADVDGMIRNIGEIATGTPITRNSSFQEVPAVAGLASVRVSGDLTGGLANDIVMTNSDGDVVQIAEGDSVTGISFGQSSISAVGGGYAIFVTPEKLVNTGWKDITIGNTDSFYGDYSILNQRTIKAEGTNGGQDVTTIFITGAENGGTTYSTTLDFGIYNGLWGAMSARSNDADATLLHIGANATVPEFVNNGNINVIVSAAVDIDDNFTGTGGDAYGVLVDQGGGLTRFENNGLFLVNADGENANAYGLVDNSGTLDEFINTGTFRVLAGPGGTATAVDLSNNTTGITFLNSDEIQGDIYLGSGNNVITLQGGTDSVIDGTIFLGNGSSTLAMSGDSVLGGGIYSPNGQLDVTINDQSALTVNTDLGLDVNNLTINDQSVINLNVNSLNGFTGGINASNTVSFSTGSTLSIQVGAVVDKEETFNIVTASNLIIDADSNIQNLGNNSYVYDLSTELTANTIDLTVRRRTSEELGLSETFSAIYEASIGAFANDADMAEHLGSIETAEDFNLFYKEILPLSLSQASLQAIQNTNDLSVSAVSAQLDGLRHMIKTVPPSRVRNGVWIQEFAGIYDQKDGINERGADVFNFGLAAGYEFALSDRGVIGVNLSYNISDVKFKESGKDRLAVQNTQLGLYSAFWLDNFFLENQASIGYLDFSSEKELVLGELDRFATADWNGLQYSGVIKAGYEFDLGALSITPTAGVNYNNVHQNSYTEVDGGAGFNLSVDDYNRNFLSTDLKLEIAHKTEFKTGNLVDSVMRIALQGGWSQHLNDDPIEISTSFEGQNNYFTVFGDPIDKNNFQAGLGVYFTSNYFAFTIRYDAEWRDQYLGHSANMNLRARF